MKKQIELLIISVKRLQAKNYNLIININQTVLLQRGLFALSAKLCDIYEIIDNLIVFIYYL